MYPDDQGLFDIGGPAGSGREGDQGGDLLLIFLLQGNKAVLDIVYQLVRPRNTNMNRRVDTDGTTTCITATRAHHDTACPGDQRLATGNGRITFCQPGLGESRKPVGL